MWNFVNPSSAQRRSQYCSISAPPGCNSAGISGRFPSREIVQREHDSSSEGKAIQRQFDVGAHAGGVVCHPGIWHQSQYTKPNDFLPNHAHRFAFSDAHGSFHQPSGCRPPTIRGFPLYQQNRTLEPGRPPRSGSLARDRAAINSLGLSGVTPTQAMSARRPLWSHLGL